MTTIILNLNNTISVLSCHFRFRIEFFKIKAKNEAIALAIESVFNVEMNSVEILVTKSEGRFSILKQKKY